MKIQIFFFMTLILVSLICVSCTDNSQDQKEIQFSSIQDVPAAAWEKLAQKKIYFGHQSVGANIMAGMQKIIRENPQIKLNIDSVDKEASYDFNSPAFLHKQVGHNLDPESKIDDFKNNIENKFADQPNIALLKFCYVDFNPNTDIDRVFTHYTNIIEEMQHQYPETTFVHVTVPLTCYAPGPRGWIKRSKDIIKKIIGKVNLYDFSSSNLYNQKLLNQFSDKEPIFDIALIESTRSNGTRVHYQKNNQMYYEMVKEYTTDGGHLNKEGSKRVAEQLLILLAQLASQG